MNKNDRPRVRINGAVYYYATQKELGREELEEISNKCLGLFNLARMPEITLEMAKEMDTLLKELIHRILPDIPEDMILKLGFRQQCEVLRLFGKKLFKDTHAWN